MRPESPDKEHTGQGVDCAAVLTSAQPGSFSTPALWVNTNRSLCGPDISLVPVQGGARDSYSGPSRGAMPADAPRAPAKSQSGAGSFPMSPHGERTSEEADCGAPVTLLDSGGFPNTT